MTPICQAAWPTVNPERLRSRSIMSESIDMGEA
jgi:hypothetical protein